MDTRDQPLSLAATAGVLVVLAILAYVAGGAGTAVALAVGAVLFTNVLVRRYAHLQPRGHFARHGDTMD
jgi:hypothetical protein